ncbi:MAG: hypothetical protein RL213_687 [Bacteroidota bacterium]|jgi:hypothetical protein
MRLISAPLRIVFRKTLLLLGVYTLLRVLFFVFNASAFGNSGTFAILSAFLEGIRFDIVAVTIVNLPYLLFQFAPESFRDRRWFRTAERSVFLIANLPFLLANCVDLGLFRFSSRRLTADIFSIMGYGEDFMNTVPKMVADFWLQGVVFLLLSWLLIAGYDHIERRASGGNTSTRSYLFSSFLLLVLVFIGFRGGIQYKPLSILSASRSGETPLILNSSFTLLKTFGKDELKPLSFMSVREAESMAPTVHRYGHDTSFVRKNVVIIILEGIGKEYVGRLSGKETYTPFLDSLLSQSFSCTQAFANGKRSIEGIPAVVAGIPTLTDEPFISSPYTANTITSIAGLLKPYGYTSVFFHGGSNGTMGFDHFSRIAGYDRYFGRKEYGDDRDFDGNWGIFDLPFLQRTATELSRLKEPFSACVFTLSSHHPYPVQPPFDTLLPAGKLPILKSVRYTDAALQSFFRTASGMPWFRNTLFVITSDHTALADDYYYKTRAGIYAIPLAFFDPKVATPASCGLTVQQADILPSVMDYLDYPVPFFALGSSIFDAKERHCAVNFLHGTYQLLQDDHSFIFDTLNGSQLYDLRKDPLQFHDIISSEPRRAATMELQLKAMLQQYNSSLLENRMTASPQLSSSR